MVASRTTSANSLTPRGSSRAKGATVHYDVRILGRAGRFDIERDEPPAKDDLIEAGSMVYKVLSVQPGEGEFDGVIEVEWQAGPGEFVA